MKNLYFPCALQSNTYNPTYRKSLLLNLLSRYVVVFLGNIETPFNSPLFPFNLIRFHCRAIWVTINIQRAWKIWQAKGQLWVKNLRSKMSSSSKELKSRSWRWRIRDWLTWINWLIMGVIFLRNQWGKESHIYIISLLASFRTRMLEV